MSEISYLSAGAEKIFQPRDFHNAVPPTGSVHVVFPAGGGLKVFGVGSWKPTSSRRAGRSRWSPCDPGRWCPPYVQGLKLKSPNTFLVDNNKTS